MKAATLRSTLCTRKPIFGMGVLHVRDSPLTCIGHFDDVRHNGGELSVRYCLRGRSDACDVEPPRRRGKGENNLGGKQPERDDPQRWLPTLRPTQYKLAWDWRAAKSGFALVSTE